MAKVVNNEILVCYSEADEADLYICEACAAERHEARYEIAEPGDQNLICGFCGSE